MQQFHRTLRTALNEARRRGHTVSNPAAIAKAPRLVEDEIEPLTVEEARRIVDAASGRRNSARLAAANVRSARLHDARHTAATMLLVLKVPTPAVMRIMGWSQASMASRYQHVATEILTGVAGQVERLLWAGEDNDGDGEGAGTAA